VGEPHTTLLTDDLTVFWGFVYRLASVAALNVKPPCPAQGPLVHLESPASREEVLVQSTFRSSTARNDWLSAMG